MQTWGLLAIGEKGNRVCMVCGLEVTLEHVIEGCGGMSERVKGRKVVEVWEGDG